MKFIKSYEFIEYRIKSITMSFYAATNFLSVMQIEKIEFNSLIFIEIS